MLTISITDILRSDQMTGRMIYQICTQRLTNEQIYMQRVTNECILRSKHEWGAGGVIDPAASQLVYQFNSKFSFETTKFQKSVLEEEKNLHLMSQFFFWIMTICLLLTQYIFCVVRIKMPSLVCDNCSILLKTVFFS